MSYTKINETNNQMSREELTRTQVLNLSDLEKVAKYEKRTSKKPALILAILGFFCIATGFSYMGIMNFINIEPVTQKADIYRKEVPETLDKTILCNYSLLNGTDGTDTTVDMKLNLREGHLVNYTKKMNVVPTLGNEAVGMVTIQSLLPAYQNFEAIQVSGYQIKSLPKGTGFETNVSIDLKNLDQTLLVPAHQSNVSTKIEFLLGDTEDVIYEKAKGFNYVCYEEK